MQKNEMPQAETFVRQKRHRKVWQKIVGSLACVVVFVTTYLLILPAITMEQTAYCGIGEHQHDAECYEKRLICGYETETAHVHTEACYEDRQVLVCTQEETPGHIHDESCVQTEQTLVCTDTSEEHTHTDDCYETTETYICGLTEGEGGHTHGPECYETQPVLICELSEEADVHIHSDVCYADVLVCELEEHTHSLACYSNPEADLETEETWERSVSGVELTGVWADDVIAVARSQLGYTESDENYIVTEDGDKKGYTRYGAWYGDAYGDWCAMFASFCLNYAEIPAEAIPYEASCARWVEALSTPDCGLYRGAADYTPEAGDLIFFDRDGDGRADHVGLVTEVTDGTEEAAAGLKTIEGNSGNCVQTASYYADNAMILGYAALPENPAYAAPEQPEEESPEEPAEEVSAEEEEAASVAAFSLEDDEGAVLLAENDEYTITLDESIMVPLVSDQTVRINFTPPYTHKYQFSFDRNNVGISVVLYDSNGKNRGSSAGAVNSVGSSVILEQGEPCYLELKLYGSSVTEAEIGVSVSKAVCDQYSLQEDGSIVCSCGTPAVTSGDCSYNSASNVQWCFENGTLTISGTGTMKNFSNSYYPTWFYFRNLITGIVVEEGVTSIGNYAFYDCGALTSFEITHGVKSLGTGCLYHCSALETIYWSAAQDIGISVASSDKLISDFKLVVTTDADMLAANDLTALIQMGCTGLEFQGPNYLTTGGLEADFLEVPLTILPVSEYYVDAQGVMYRIDSETNTASLAYCPAGIESYVVPETLPTLGEKDAEIPVTGVDSYAFFQASDLTALEFEAPDSITQLSDFAFWGAKQLASINGKSAEIDVLATFPNAQTGTQLFENTSIAYTSTTTGDALTIKKDNLVLTISTVTSEYHEPAQTEDGTFLYYTGETARTTITVSNPDSSEVDEGTVVRVYVRFDNSEGTINYAVGTYDVVSQSGKTYSITVGKTAVPNCYYVDLQRPEQGDTLSIDLTSRYPSPSSKGGSATIWGGILTAAEAESLGNGLLPAKPAQAIDWSAVPDTFPVTKKLKTTGSAKMVGDGEGGAYINGLAYTITMSRAGDTLEGIGKDFMTSVDFVDVLTLPDGVQVSEALAQEIRNHTYTYSIYGSDGLQFYTASGSMFLSMGAGYPHNYQISNVMLDIDETGSKLTVGWTISNNDLSTEIGNITASFEIKSNYISVPAPEEAREYIVRNDVTAVQHFMHSADQERTDGCDVMVSTSAGELKLTKNLTSLNQYYGSTSGYTIVASNPGAMPYERLAYLTDTLPSLYYMRAEDLAEIFTDDTEHQLSITIRSATICQVHQSEQVTGIDGTTAGNTILQNTGAGTAYHGMENSDADVIGNENAATITLNWGEGGSLLIALNGGAPVSCSVDAESIQQVLDSFGFLVTINTQYEMCWDLTKDGQPCTLIGGASITKDIPCTVKDTFMLLDADQRNYHPIYYRYASNYVYAYDVKNEQLTERAGSSYRYQYREFFLYKNWYVDGTDVEKDTKLEQGAILEYALTVQHKNSDAYYQVLPLVDHMTGAQALLVPVEKNQNAEWAENCTAVTKDGIDYYLLREPGTYKNVWTSDTQLADTVTVQTTSSGLDTLIKWYFTDYTGSRTDKVTYHAYVCPNDVLPGQVTYSLGNECWLSDHQSHRLYAAVDGWDGTTFDFDKVIVDSVGDTGLGWKYSAVEEGETVVYRLMLESGRDDDGNYIEMTMQGSNMYDALPNSISGYRWSTDNVTITYADDYTVDNPDSWSVTDPGGDQQYIRWGDDFSMTFTGKAYIYVTLTFPSDLTWQEYARRYGTTTLINTYHVFNAQASVTHDLSIAAQVRLQKGVYASGYSYFTGSVTPNPAIDSRWYYNNSDKITSSVQYYVSLYNGGYTNLYLTEMQDRLPRGFTLAYCGSFTEVSSAAATVYRTGNTTATLKTAGISTSVRTENGTQYITFHFSQYSSSSGVRYDESREMCYLAPGEAIVFRYICYTSAAADTDDAARNIISMPYFDFTGGGVEVDPNSRTVAKDSDKYTPNDGGCEVEKNGQAESHGFTGGTTDTQWLTSEVTVTRGAIKPGITKALTSKTDNNGEVTQNPISVASTDTLQWTITAENDGTYSIVDYTLTDIMQSPYLFVGKVNYQIYIPGQSNAVGSPGYGSCLFQILSVSGDQVKVQSQYESNKYDTQTLTIGGDPVTLKVYWSGEKTIDVAMFRDTAGNIGLSVHLADKSMAIPAGGKGVLTLSTQNSTNTLENKQFVNSCFITPVSQTWDGTTNKGNMTMLETRFCEGELPTVRNSAPVTTSYGYATSSIKRITEVDDLTNTAASTDDPNYIVLQNAGKLFNYTISVDNSTPKAMDKLILIDGLPEVGDHTAFLTTDPRFSEFKVSLAEEPGFTVTVTAKDGTETTLNSDSYKIEFSDKKEFTDADWNGTSTWSSDLTGARSIRLIIEDSTGTLIPADSTISLTFTCKIDDVNAQPGQIAWNSFGYHYRLYSETAELEAAPLKVGVKIPGVPELRKQVVDHSGQPVAVDRDSTFTFLVYEGAALSGSYSTRDELIAALGETPYQEYAVVVEAGESLSTAKLAETENWTWTKGQQYTVTELPTTEEFSFNRFYGTTGNSYTFTYDPAQTQVISCENTLQSWTISLTKQNPVGDCLPGAVFALYSPEASDQIAVPDAYADLDIPVSVEENGQTWYLVGVGTTGEGGKLEWTELLRSSYYLLEVKAPDGYFLSDPAGQILERKYESQGVYSLTIVNSGGYKLPETGGTGTALYTIGGMSLILGAAALLLYTYIRRRKEETASS